MHAVHIPLPDLASCPDLEADLWGLEKSVSNCGLQMFNELLGIHANSQHIILCPLFSERRQRKERRDDGGIRRWEILNTFPLSTCTRDSSTWNSTTYTVPIAWHDTFCVGYKILLCTMLTPDFIHCRTKPNKYFSHFNTPLVRSTFWPIKTDHIS